MVSFSNYQKTISLADTSACMQQAIAECLRSFSFWNLSIAEVVKAYVSNSVTLSLYPKNDMLWREWIIGVKALEWFLETYTPVGMLFRIEVTSKGIVGYGAFTSMNSNATNSTTVHAPNIPK